MESEVTPVNPSPLAGLRWYLDAGVNELAGATPVNRFVEPAAVPQPTRNAPPPDITSQRTVMPAARLASADQLRGEAEEIARGCNSLAELEAAVRAFNGCALKQTAMNTVFSDGDPASPLMFVGEAPGDEEDRQGRPFVGASGKLLNQMLAAIGRDRTNCYITNILFWRPPGNRKPTPQETAVCLPFVKRHIELVHPQVLVFLGGTSAGVLLDTTQGITRLRGKWTSYKVTSNGGWSVPALPTYHPAYLLRQPQLKADAWRDFLDIQAKLEAFSGD